MSLKFAHFDIYAFILSFFICHYRTALFEHGRMYSLFPLRSSARMTSCLSSSPRSCGALSQDILPINSGQSAALYCIITIHKLFSTQILIMGKDGNCSKSKQSKGKETDASSSSLGGNAHTPSLLEMSSILSTLVGRQLTTEEIKVISEDPMKTKIENLMLKNNSLCAKLKTLSSLRDQLMTMRKRKAELKHLEESRQHEGKGWWEVNVDDLKTVEEVKEVAMRAAEFQNLLVDHLNNLKLNSADKKDASSSG